MTNMTMILGAIAAFPAGFLVDWRGRRESIFWSCVITLVGAILQSAAVNIGMFILGRFIIGMGLAVAATATPTYVAETVPPKSRALALGLYYSCWGVGTLIASGVCYRVSISESLLETKLTRIAEPIHNQHLGLADPKHNPNFTQYFLYFHPNFRPRITSLAHQ